MSEQLSWWSRREQLARCEWGTPRWLFEELHHEFGFTVDACAVSWNAKLPRYWSPAEDGLAQAWGGERVWCNPPYGVSIEPWLEKAREAELAVLLVPCRTESRWWHEVVLEDAAEVRFVRGRVHFVRPGRTASDSRPVFSSAVVVFRAGGGPPRVGPSITVPRLRG